MWCGARTRECLCPAPLLTAQLLGEHLRDCCGEGLGHIGCGDGSPWVVALHTHSGGHTCCEVVQGCRARREFCECIMHLVCWSR